MRTKTLRMLPVLGLALVAAAPGIAQENHGAVPPSGVVRKNRAPVAKTILRVHFPRPVKYVLPNGMELLVLENHKLPTVGMTMTLLAGSFFDPADRQGVAGLTADMLTEGTKTRTSAQIARTVDRMGASLGADADQGGERARVSASGLSTDTDALLGLLRDVLRNPTFPADQFRKIQQRTIAGLTQATEDPDTLAEIATMRAIYGETPPARVMPSIAQVKAITPKDLAAFHATYYRPDRAILGVVGDVKAADVYAKVKRAFGDWKRGTAPLHAALPNFAPQPSTRVFLVDRPSSVQTVIHIGNLAINRTSPDYPAFSVMNRILGGDPISSRLGADLREAKGYTYDVSSYFDAPRYRGYWVAQTQVRNAVTSGALTSFFDEFQRISDQPVTPTELEDAKRGIIGSFARRMESPDVLLAMALQIEEFGLPADYWDTYPAKIQAVTAADVQRMAREYLQTGRMQIIAVGDPAAVTPALQKYGPVNTLDLTAALS